LQVWLIHFASNYIFLSFNRSFYIAISFVQQKRFKESAAFVNKTETYMEQAKKTVNEGQQPKTSEINYQV
jgi:hypothetical protein